MHLKPPIALRWRLAAGVATAVVLAALHATPAFALRQADASGHLHGVTLRTPLARSFAASRTATPVDNLAWGGGPVMHTNATHTLYWDPAAAIPGAYQSAVNTFLSNVAAASGAATNVYSIDAQYSDSGGHIQYGSTFAGALADSDPFPGNGCPTTAPRTVCLTDAQIQSELGAYIAQHHLPTGLGDIYFVLTPPNVDTCFDSSASSCSSNYYCAYHDYFQSGGQTIVYADDPYPDGGCSLNEYPNQPGTAADEAINTLSHEHNESITDPELDAWGDSSGNEIGDKCDNSFGPLLGGGSGAGYDQEIASGHYYLQEEWSNNVSDCAAAAQATPVPALSVSPQSVTAGQSVTADASASSELGGAIASYSISFGDGTSGSGRIETHVYAAPGVYTVTLTVTDTGGTTATASRTVMVADRPPWCGGSTASVSAGGSVMVTLPCSDPDAGDQVTRAIVAGPHSGTLGAIDQATGSVSYTPAPGFSGADSFQFAARDSHGASSATEQVTVSVQAPAVHATSVRLGPLRLSRTVVKAGARAVHVSYTLSQPGVTTFFVERAVSGRRRGGRCVRSRSRHGAACHLYVRLRGSVRRADGAGTSDVKLASILRRFSLRPGSYRLVASFRAADGTTAQASTRFRISR